MTSLDWMRVIDEAADLGCRSMQIIGGEPTTYSALPALIRYALHRGMAVEVYTNLLKVPPPFWEAFELDGVSLATSYYSSDAAQHDAITGRRSHGRTLANIIQARSRGIPIRVGMVAITDDQQVGVAAAQLQELGITDITLDHLRKVGRGRRLRDAEADVGQLCGHCATSQLAVTPDGTAFPCTLSRWLALGNVRTASLAAIHAGATPVRLQLEAAFAARVRAGECDPAGRKREGDGNCNLCDPVVRKLVKPRPPQERCGPDIKKGRP